MAVQLGRSASPAQPVGVRRGGERRRGGRRSRDRGTSDRRRGQRRRATLRSLLFTALTLAVPHQVKHKGLNTGAWPHVLQLGVPGPRVSVSIDSFVPVPAKRAYDAFIKEAAALYRVDPASIRSVIETESAFDPFAVSRAGAQGLMQLMPEVAAEFGVDDPFDPRQNIMAGASYLRQLLNQHRGNVVLVASYNAGPGVVARYGGRVPPFSETRHYVKCVTGLLAAARTGGD